MAHRHRVVSGFAALLFPGVVGCEAESTVDLGPDVVPRALTAQRGDYFDVELAPSGVRGQAMQAEGYLVLDLGYTVTAEPPWPPGPRPPAVEPVQGSCGVTFVSPNHAITAAHCTQGVPAGGALPVRVPRLARGYFWGFSVGLGGAYPSFEHFLNPAYADDEYACNLVARCGSSSFGLQVDCDITLADVDFYSPNDTALRRDGDIALLECAGAPGEVHGYIEASGPVASGDPLLMPWYHELYDASQTPGTDEFENYTRYRSPLAGGPNPNYHYIGGPGRHQLLPMMSTDDPGRWHVDSVGIGPSLTTTLLGCHGTSGSGVMSLDPETGLPELVGPATTAANMSMVHEGTTIPLLCHPSLPAGTRGISTPRWEYTQFLVGKAQVADCSDASTFPSVLAYWLECTGFRFPEPEEWWRPFPPPCLVCTSFARFRWFWPGVPIMAAAEPIEIALRPAVLGKRYRVSVRAYGVELPAKVWLKVGDEVIASHDLGSNDDVWIDGIPSAVLSGSFVATAATDGPIQIIATSGQGVSQLGISDVVLIEDGEVGAFDLALDRDRFALLTDPQSPAQRMRFASAPDGEGFVAILEPGERMIANFQGLLPDREWDLALSSSESAQLSCGLIFEDGSETAVACDTTATARLDGVGLATPIAWFVENPGANPLVLEDAGVSEVQANCATAHDKCVTGEALDMGCGSCVDAICQADAYCCTAAWDSICVGEVRTVCSSLACPDSAGACTHSQCSSGPSLTAGCDAPPLATSCVDAICQVDPYCCATYWDGICVGEVASVCGYTCG